MKRSRRISSVGNNSLEFTMISKIICLCALVCIVSGKNTQYSSKKYVYFIFLLINFIGYPKIDNFNSKSLPVMCEDQEDCLSHCLFTGHKSGNCNKDKICICIPNHGSSGCSKRCEKSCMKVGYDTGVCNDQKDCSCHHIKINVLS